MLERSKFNESVWRSPLSNSEHPTPYAYLLYEITHDLDRLSAKALQKATSKSAPPRVEAPSEIAQALARTWSFCIWSIADSEGQVGPEFRNHVIKRYLLFMLALDQEPSEISFSPEGWDMGDLRVWRDLFLHELKARFVGDAEKGETLKEAFESLDHGKSFVSEGETWLKKSLFG